MAKRIKLPKKFSWRKVAVFGAIAAVVGITVLSLSFASSGGLVCNNNYCTTPDHSSASMTFNPQSKLLAGGGLSCQAKGSGTITWQAAWRNAKGKVELLAGNDSHVFRPAGKTAPTSGSGTWIERGLKANRDYRGELHNITATSSQVIAAVTCRTKKASNVVSVADNTQQNSPSVNNGQIVSCYNSYCTSSGGGTISQGGGSGSSSSSSSSGSGSGSFFINGNYTGNSTSTATTTVCTNGVCHTYTTSSNSGSIGQSLNCTNGNCTYSASSARRSGLRGLVSGVGSGIKNLVQSIFGGLFGR